MLRLGGKKKQMREQAVRLARERQAMDALLRAHPEDASLLKDLDETEDAKRLAAYAKRSSRRGALSDAVDCSGAGEAAAAAVLVAEAEAELEDQATRAESLQPEPEPGDAEPDAEP
eukprot:COSAG02_NODE_6145_length_3768_cov_8.162442_1_plen_115_part_10